MTQSVASSRDVRWIEPQIVRGVAVYEHRCEAELTTPESIEFRQRLNRSTICTNYAKIEYRGEKLCVKHAEKKALREALNQENNS